VVFIVWIVNWACYSLIDYFEDRRRPVTSAF
jgi:hypothetical protein